MIRRTSREEVAQQGFRPEEHTTAFNYDGDWWCYQYGDRVVAVLCVRMVSKKFIITSVYTLPEFRGRGIMHNLVDFVSNSVYEQNTIYAHCLISSKRIFEDCGYLHYHTVPYKHGTQYFMKKGGQLKYAV